MKALVQIFLSLALFYRGSCATGAAAGATATRFAELEYTLIMANSPDCPSSQAYPAPELHYRQGENSEWTTLTNKQLVTHANFTTSKRARVDISRFVLNGSHELQGGSQFRFVQSEHRGGFCDCWAVANLTLNDNIGLNIQCGKKINLEEIFEMAPNKLPGYDYDDVIAGFCQDTALIPREFIATQGQTNPQAPNCTSTPRFNTPQTNCADSDTRIEVSFDLKLWFNCDGIDDFSEGVELSFRRTLEDGTTSDWIPLMYITSSLLITQPYVWLIPSELRGSSGIFTLRGYDITYIIQSSSSGYQYHISMCGSDILRHPLQFRWQQNAFQLHFFVRDVVLLDNVSVRVKNGTHYAVLLEDCFDYHNSLTASQWNLNLSYNVHLNLRDTHNPGCANPSINDQALFFYARLPEAFFSLLGTDRQGRPANYTVTSRQVVTNSLNLNNVKWSRLDPQVENILMCEPEVTSTTTAAEMTTESERTTNPMEELLTTTMHEATTTFTSTDVPTTTPEATTIISTDEVPHTEGTLSSTAMPEMETVTEAGTTELEPTTSVIQALQFRIDVAVFGSRESRSLSLSNLQALIQLEHISFVLECLLKSLLSSSRECDVDLTAAVSILSYVVMKFGNQTVEGSISEIVLSIGSRLMDIAQANCSTPTKDDPPEVLAGSTLLKVMDMFTLNNHDPSHRVTSENIKFLVEELKFNETDEIYSLHANSEIATIQVPVREILSSSGNEDVVRMVSLLFRNMSGFLPERIREETGINSDSESDGLVFRLASPVISASFQCDTCTTSNLSTPVQVTFKHTDYDKALLENDDANGTVRCVFWEFNDTENQSGAILVQGRWSREDCETDFNSTMTVCKCNHLTHFAILLSARPLDLSPQKTLSLQIIGYIGVSISLVAMAATVFVFLFLKPLRTMRNYIHIQLCVTLGIAQIIFVAGIEPRLGEGHLVDGVPVGCRLVAVLLHYWFLVSFMWMLMEGVVLYVALVRVFIKHHARYIAAFTIASYGLPLLYVGGLTAPIGFIRTENFRQNQSYDYGYEQACYLNPVTFIWSLIAPVILIFLANIGFFIMAVTIMCRHQKRQRREKKTHKVKHWLKAVVSLTVVMGITWIIGVLVIKVEELCPLAYIFTIFVAFQGLFIFVIFVLLSKQVKENYAKWWKAKVAESDFLSKHFGEKSLSSSAVMAPRSPPSTSTSAREKSSSNGLSMTSNNTNKTGTLTVDNTDSDLCKLSLEMSCEKSHDLENNPVISESTNESTFIPNGLSLNGKGVSLNGSSAGDSGFKRASPNHYAIM